MSEIGKFQNRVKDLIGPNFNFQVDRAHGEKEKHVDLTVRIPSVGADKADVDFNGNVVGGSTYYWPQKSSMVGYFLNRCNGASSVAPRVSHCHLLFFSLVDVKKGWIRR